MGYTLLFLSFQGHSKVRPGQHPNGGSLGQARLITPSVVSERLKVNGSVARQAIRHLEDPFWKKSVVTMVTVGPFWKMYPLVN